MKTTPERLDAFRTQLTDTIEHGTELLVDLKALNDGFPKLLPLLANLSERQRATEIAVCVATNNSAPCDWHRCDGRPRL